MSAYSQFQVGDRVKCINPMGRLILNKEYIVEKGNFFDGNGEYIYIKNEKGDEEGSFLPRRFEIVKPVEVIKSESIASFIIHFHDSRIAKLYFEMAKDFGINYESITGERDTPSEDTRAILVTKIDNKVVMLCFKRSRDRRFISEYAEKNNIHIIFEGATDYAQILATFQNNNAILKKNKELIKPVPVPPEVNGYFAKYTKNSNYVDFGCARLSIDFLQAMRRLFNASCAFDDISNRKVTFIELDSRVKLSRKDVNDTLNYVRGVNNN